MEPCPRVQPHSIATELHIGLYNREDGVKITKSRDKTHVDDDEALFLDIVVIDYSKRFAHPAGPIGVRVPKHWHSEPCLGGA